MARRKKFTITQFTRYCGYKSTNSIKNAIKDGSLDGFVIQEGEDVFIVDPEAAREYWASIKKKKTSNTPSVLRGGVEGKKNIPNDEDSDEEIDLTAITEETLHNYTMDDVAKLERYYKAKKAEFEFKRIEGSMVHADDVKRTLGEFMAQIKVSIEKYPELVVDGVMAAKTRKDALKFMRMEVHKILTKLAS